ncbi:winged helix-turn-helix transcriptional regulator [Candidatus Thiodiazotropha endoloripes]|uniref:winged helix-turn-helix transcriptional regulator n=1 Tax=Candidatus Thiodiazotropha endoloripes TaxID=1818881 RepID=UPI0009F5CB36
MVKADNNRNTTKRTVLPISSALGILSDKWSLLVVRDLFTGITTYNDLQCSPEKRPTNILANRLTRLTGHQIVEKKPYQQHPVRYEEILTP